MREIRNKVEAAGGRLPYASANPGIPSLGKTSGRHSKNVIAETNRRYVYITFFVPQCVAQLLFVVPRAAVSTASFGVYDKKVHVEAKSTKKKIQKNRSQTKHTGKKKTR